MTFQDGISDQHALQEDFEKPGFDPLSRNEITSDGSIEAVTADWTSDEERRLVRKCGDISSSFMCQTSNSAKTRHNLDASPHACILSSSI
jgi:hypothetical protein